MISPRRRSSLARDFRWSRVALTVLVVAGALAVVWWLAARGPGEPIRVLVASRLSAVAAPASEPDPAAVAAVLPPAERDPGLVEVCGLGWVEKKAETDTVDPAVLVSIPGIEATLDATLDRLRRSPDAIARAAALVFATSVSPSGDDHASLREQLSQEAATTNDPRLYALAFRMCKGATTGSCALLSAAQWARLDEGNGEPWLFILDDAATRGDRAAVDEALYRIGAAARFDDRYFALTAAVAAEVGMADLDLMAAQMLTIGLSGVAAAQWVPLQRFDACRGAELADANRRQVCDAVAVTLAERSDSMMFASIGARIGERIGWDEERVVAIHALSLALADSGSAIPDVQQDGVSYSCRGVRAFLARFARMAEVGEPQAARDWIAASGKSVEPFARQAREAREASLRARAAASAASAPRPGS